MARKRTKTRTRTVYAKPKKSYKRSSSSNAKVEAIQFDAMIYGGARGYISDFLKPFTENIPFGSIVDELSMGVLDYFVAKNTKGMARNIALKGLVVENARLGEAVVTGELGDFMNNDKSKDKATGLFLN